MGNDTLVRSVSSEYHPISTWAATRVHRFASQDGELIVWSRIGECETFGISVLVRIPASANCLAVLVVPVSLLNGRVYIRLDIACRAAGFGTLTLLADVSVLDWRAKWGEEIRKQDGRGE